MKIVIRTYGMIYGGVEKEDTQDEIKLEHVTFDMDNAKGGQCPVCGESLDEESNCVVCGYMDTDDLETMIERYKAWADD